MDITIRLAEAGDLPTVAAILDRAVGSKMYRGDLDWGDKAYDDNSLAAAVTRSTLFVAETTENGIVGTFRLEPSDSVHWGQQPPDAVYVERFATAGGYGGQHLGSQIFECIAQAAQSGGKQFVRLICPAKNTKLATYHESNNFVRADFKARPTMPTAVVYYERAVAPNYREPEQVTAKRGLLGRLHRNR